MEGPGSLDRESGRCDRILRLDVPAEALQAPTRGPAAACYDSAWTRVGDDGETVFDACFGVGRSSEPAQSARVYLRF